MRKIGIFFVVLTMFCAVSFATSNKSKGPALIKVMSYNIRMGEANDGTNSWRYRSGLSIDMIKEFARKIINTDY